MDEQIMAHHDLLRTYRQPLSVEGWYTAEVVAIPPEVLRTVVGETLTDKAAAQMLLGLGLLAATEGNGRATMRAYNTGIWRAPCPVYVISREALARLGGSPGGEASGSPTVETAEAGAGSCTAISPCPAIPSGRRR